MKRILFVLGMFTLVLLGGVAVFLLVRNARTQSRILAIRKSGDPTSIAELEPGGINTSNNAATHLRPIVEDAQSLSRSLEPLLSGNGFDWVKGLSAADLQAADDHIARFPGVFDKIDLASRCSRFSWGWDYSASSNVFSFDIMDDINDTRTFSRLSDLRARYLAAKGKPEEAAAACLTQLRLCRAQDDLPTMVGFLLNTACRSDAMRGLNALLQTTKLTSQTHDAIDDELALHDSMKNYVFTMKTERAFGIATMEEQLGFFGGMSGVIDGYLDLMEQEIELGAMQHHETSGYKRIVPTGFASMLLPDADASRDAVDRNLAMIRCLRIVNRIKKLENHTHPASDPSSIASQLDLPALATTDPYNGKPVVIRRIKEGWIIYCVGADQLDGTGSIGDFSDVGFGPPELILQ